MRGSDERQESETEQPPRPSEASPILQPLEDPESAAHREEDDHGAPRR